MENRKIVYVRDDAKSSDTNQNNGKGDLPKTAAMEERELKLLRAIKASIQERAKNDESNNENSTNEDPDIAEPSEAHKALFTAADEAMARNKAVVADIRTMRHDTQDLLDRHEEEVRQRNIMADVRDYEIEVLKACVEEQRKHRTFTELESKCLGAQAQIKDRQIRNRDEQIRMQLQGDLDERYGGESVMYVGQVDELNHQLSKTIDTLNWTIGNQAVVIEDKDKKIGELEKQVGELEQELASLRGQGLPFRPKE
ncbi:hypothetical protein IWX47DRAFT_929241 [Phyllosticta citricarpa]